MPFPPKVLGYDPQLPPRPEGAEMRYSERVRNEIAEGNFAFEFGWLHDEPYCISPGRWDKEIGSAAFNETFSLSIRSRWFGLAKPAVYLMRGNDILTDLLTKNEKALLVQSYGQAEKVWAERKAQEKADKEAKRQRAAWWP